MKKIFVTLVCILAVVFAANAKDKPKKLTELPATAQQFLKKYFEDKQFSYATQDTDLFDGEYKVVFTDGDKVEFDSKGNWKDIECKKSINGVPAGIIPAAIKQYLDQNHKDSKVVEIEYDKNIKGGYEVKLIPELELKFNKNGKFIGIDS